MQGQSRGLSEPCGQLYDLAELGRSVLRPYKVDLRAFQAGDFAHAGEGAADVRDGDGAADDERDVKSVDDFVAVPAFFAAADKMVGDAIVAAKHGGGDKAEEFLGFGTERAGLVGLVVEGEEALDAEMGAGENFLVEVGAKFLEGVEVGHGSSSLIKARHYRKNCGRDAKARSDQREDARPSTRPGRAPVALLELQTSTPFAKTFSMPTGKANGLEKVERSMTVPGLKSTRSAKAPSRRMPRSFHLRRFAGSVVILRIASGSVSQCFSRTYKPRTRGKVPAPRGCREPIPPSLATMTQGCW